MNVIDQHLRTLVDEQYELCNYKCNEKAGPGNMTCKEACFKKIIVPYRFQNHVAKGEEDNLYRKCLGEKFPKIKQTDYAECTQKLYADRVQVLSNYMFKISEGILQDLH
jgi:hypothetical protein